MSFQPLLFLVKPQTINGCSKKRFPHFSPHASAVYLLPMQVGSQSTWFLQRHRKGFRSFHWGSEKGSCLCCMQTPWGWLFPKWFFLLLKERPRFYPWSHGMCQWAWQKLVVLSEFWQVTFPPYISDFSSLTYLQRCNYFRKRLPYICVAQSYDFYLSLM